MTDQDRLRWDSKYLDRGAPRGDEAALAAVFAPYEEIFPTVGRALDIACGPGLGSVWLARRGLRVHGFDVSAVAIGHARELALRSGVADRCRFDVVDLDTGLPAGPPVAVVYCHKFRDHRLDRGIIDRLAPGGLLAMVVLSAVGAAPGPFRAVAGELPTAFAELDTITAGEGRGRAWLLARRSTPAPARVLNQR